MSIALGGVIGAIHAPGHTQGATVWMTSVEDGGRGYAVAFMGTTTPNGGVPLFGNPRHKNVVEDTRRAFRILKAEPEPDIVLVGHPRTMFAFAGTMERLRKGERPHPLLNGLARSGPTSSRRVNRRSKGESLRRRAGAD